MEELVEVTLHDTLSDALDAAEATSLDVTDPPSVARDEVGRFATKDSVPADKSAKPVPDTPAAKPVTSTQPLQADPLQTAPALKVPSTWKKENHEHFQRLATDNPALANYILERESQYANGVSTYKQEVDRQKPILEALAPLQDDFRANNIAPEKWIRDVAEVHTRLFKGSPQEKISTLQGLARTYGIPLQAIQQGAPDALMSHLTPLQEELRAVKGQLTNWQQQQEQREMTTLQTEVASFAEKHPHYEAVRETMAGLLQSNVATDLQSAYDKAIRLNDDVWQSEQLRLSNERAEQDRAEKSAKVSKARSQVTSVRSATPGTMAGNGAADLRGTLNEAFDAVSTGRV